MALASTRLSFFTRYGLVIQNGWSIFDGFERLATTRNWRRGSKSRKYEKAWRECFGDSIPVGNTRGQEEEEFAQLLSDLEDFDLEDPDLQGRKGGKRQKQLRKVAQQFGTYYGMDDRALESWQVLCMDCGIDGELASINECKKVSVWVTRTSVADMDRR